MSTRMIDESTKEHLAHAAKLARQLRGIVADELWPRRRALRVSMLGGDTSLKDLKDLHAVRTVLAEWFNARERDG
jgi:hypothetical protein